MPGLILKTPIYKGFDYELYKMKLLNGSIKLQNLTTIELKHLQIASLIARDGFMAQFNVTISTDDFIERLKNDFPSFWHLVDYEDFKTLNVAYHIYGNWSQSHFIKFIEVLCPCGFCYTFNFPTNIKEFFKLDNLSKDFNYTSNYKIGDYLSKSQAFLEDKLHYPVKTLKSTSGMNFRFSKNYFKSYDDDVVRSSGKYGYSYSILEHALPSRDFYGLPMIIHGPYEVVSNRAMKFYTHRNYAGKILITPKVSNFHESMIDLNVEERGCYLPKERHLKFFNAYNRVKCEHECLANLTLITCGCTQFFMVREEKTKICGVADEKCFRKVKDEFLVTKSVCKCYELCEKVDYDVKVDLEKLYKINRDPKFDINYAVEKVLPINRRKQYTSIDFISLIGGFFGLFAGFSVLSGFEIIQSFMFEPIFSLMKQSDSKVYPINNFKKPLTTVKKYFEDFINNSSIHGLNHIGNEKMSGIERLIWLFLFALSMFGSYFMVKQVYQSLRVNQIMMTMEGRATRFEEIPFPAITFTDRSQLYSWHLFQIEQIERKFFMRSISVSEYIMQKFSLIFNKKANNTYHQLYGQICDDLFVSSVIDFKFSFNNSDEFMKELRNVPGRDNWPKIQISTWNAIKKPSFVETLTKRGFGQTFNLLDQETLLNFDKLSPDFRYEYKDSAVAATLPWSTSTGESKGLFVDVIKLYCTHVCSKNTFAIHSPNELPMGVEFNNFIFENAYDVVISPEIVTADDSLRTINIEDRKCYFEDERKLKYFKIYTQKNCEMECLSHVVYNICNCVPFYFIRNYTMKICDYRTYYFCISKSNLEKLAYEDYEHLYLTNNVCKCYQLCNSITYNYEIREIYNHYKEVTLKERLDAIKGLINLTDPRTTLTFRYKNSKDFALLRYQPFKLVDFLSYVGGILGLFAGISMLSIVEICYYLTLRLFNDILKSFKK